MDAMTNGNPQEGEFPEERLVTLFVSAVGTSLNRSLDPQEREDVRGVIAGCLVVGYRHGLMDAMPPVDPEDLEAFAHRFTALAGRMRWVRDGGTDPGPPLELNTEEESSERDVAEPGVMQDVRGAAAGAVQEPAGYGDAEGQPSSHRA